MYTKYEENPFAGFLNTTIAGKIFLATFLLVPYFHNLIGGCL